MQLTTFINRIIIAKLLKEIINILLLSTIVLVEKSLYEIFKVEIY